MFSEVPLSCLNITQHYAINTHIELGEMGVVVRRGGCFKTTNEAVFTFAPEMTSQYDIIQLSLFLS